MTTANAVPQLTILVPTRNEAENVEPLLGRLSAEVEPDTVVLFVDDSDDDTPHVIQAARERGFGSLDVRLLHRSGAQRTGGLGGAVLAGLERTDTQWVASWTETSSTLRKWFPDSWMRPVPPTPTSWSPVATWRVRERGPRCPNRGLLGIDGTC